MFQFSSKALSEIPNTTNLDRKERPVDERTKEHMIIRVDHASLNGSRNDDTDSGYQESLRETPISCLSVPTKMLTLTSSICMWAG